MEISQLVVIWKDLMELMQNKDFDAALVTVENLIDQGCVSSDLLELRGRLIQIADKSGMLFPDLTLEIAKSSFESAIAISRQPIGPLIELGYYKYAVMVDRTAEALAHFDDAEQNAMSGLKDALIGQAKCHLELGDQSKANAILDRLRLLYPYDEDSKIAILEMEENF